MRLPLLCAIVALILPTAATAQGVVACDARILRIVRNLRTEPMTPEQADRAREALYRAVEKCRPLSSSAPAPGPPARLGQTETPPDTNLDRQSWRAQQNVLTPAERREGERRLDAIDQKAQTDPRAARDMQRIWQQDQALGTMNRPIPNAGGGPSLVGPGDRY